MSGAASQNVASAKAAIQAFCTALQLLGLPSLPAEAVRQAKFASGQLGPLWRVLHDVVLWCCAGSQLHSHHAAALSSLWTVVESEQLLAGDADSSGTSPGQEGRDMVVYQLLAWGCPEHLVIQLQSEQATTRHLLLALVWVSARFNLFGRALEALVLPADALLMLPPYPEDTQCSMGSQQAYTLAVQSAGSQTRAVISQLDTLCQRAMQAAMASTPAQAPITRTGLRPVQAQPPGGGHPQASSQAEQGMWQAVDAAQHMVAMMLGKARAARMSLQSQLDAITRLHGEVHGLQASTWPRATPLPPLQLSLLQQPPVMQQHTEALTSATQALQQQMHLAQGAQMFFLWAASVVAEEEQACPAAATAAAPVSAPTHSMPVPGPKQRGHPAQASGALASLAALPAAGTPAASALLLRLQQQLSSTQRAAQPALAYASQQQGTGAPWGKPKAGSSSAVITVQHFRELARTALSTAPTAAAATAVAHGAGLDKPASAGSYQLAGCTPATGDRAVPGWDLPADIVTCMADDGAAHAQEEHHSSWLQAQLLQRLGSCSSSCRLVTGYKPAGDDVGAVDASSETSRLVDLTLAVAKSLAHTRSTHRQALAAVRSSLESQQLLAVGLT